VARALRDAGFEVIYLGLRKTPKEIVAAAIQEDVDVLGLSVLSGAHLPLVRKVFAELEREGADVPVVVGGVIPERDVGPLLELGAAGVFPSSSPLAELPDRIRAIVSARPGELPG
jgi:methylmalonyl-CoA mutase C-terminal domain/subunit